MKGAILLLLISACLRAQQGSLEGTAIHAVTREPLSNVHVRLIAATFAGITGAYGAMSDRTGHFSFATIRPGTYILLPERAGFLHVQPKGGAIPNLTIKAGEHQTGYQLEMAPRAVISGRVVDEAGDPVQGVQVQTVPVTPGSTPVLMMPAPSPATDDRGEFRLAGPAGKFYVQATVNTGYGPSERPEKRSDGSSEAIYGTTFYPSSIRKDRGTVVEAVAGKEVSGIEIRLARQQQQGLAISGVVSGFPEGTNRGFVAMQFGESARRVTSVRTTTPGTDGKFRFDGLQPGYYQVWARFGDGKTELASRSLEFQLENAEIANVELALSPGLELTGSLKMEGDAAGAGAPKRTVKLEPARSLFMGSAAMTGGEVDGGGAFRIGNIVPGKYRVTVTLLRENGYIKTLEIDGAAVTNGIADLSRVVRGASAKVTLGSNGAQISGRVLDSNGERMPTTLAMIFLARDPEDIPLTGNGSAQSTPDGKYTIKAVVPGKYRIFALSAFEIASAAGADGLDMFKKLFERAEEIEFKEGDRIVKDLKAIPVEDPNAKPKK